jgi:uncharacterized protein involved in exopolysaccharide biosynthesis
MRSRQDDMDEFTDAGGQGAQRPGLPVEPLRIWLSVKQDWKWIPIAAVVWGALGVAVALLFIGHSYKSQTLLIWEPPEGRGNESERELSTQAGSLKLPATMRAVKARLKTGVPVVKLSAQVEIWYAARSNLVTIETTGATANDAMRLGATIVEVFFDQQRRLSKTRADEAVKNLEADERITRARLEAARQAYDAYRTQNGFHDIDADIQLAVGAVNQLKQQQQLARTDATTLAARADQLAVLVQQKPKMTVQAASTSNPDALMLAQLRTQLLSARARLAPDHPQIASLEAQAAALELRVKQGLGVVSGSTSAPNPEYAALQSTLSTTRLDKESAASRDHTYEDLIRAGEQRVVALTALQGTAQRLTSEVRLVEGRLNEMEANLSEARDAARTPQFDWRIFDKPALPESAEKTTRKVVVMSMPLAGAFFAIFALCVRPILNRRVYTAREAAFWTGFPVLAATPWPRNRDMFYPLLGDLGDQGAAARGYTLVLGGTPREKPVAEELAYWLGGRGVTESGDQIDLETAAVVQPIIVTEAPKTGHGHGGDASEERGGRKPSEALVAFQPAVSGSAALTVIPEGTHAWLGTIEGPSLRRAARSADRVIVLLTAGAERFTSIAGLKTRLGRDSGIGIVLLSLDSEFLKLPDRVGNVDAFWRQSVSGRRHQVES